uniref:Uncharacterized protein n=1 Tax=Oryza punctata TaxID=4537 RepID=A0A0E0JVQ7_ORYPU
MEPSRWQGNLGDRAFPVTDDTLPGVAAVVVRSPRCSEASVPGEEAEEGAPILLRAGDGRRGEEYHQQQQQHKNKAKEMRAKPAGGNPNDERDKKVGEVNLSKLSHETVAPEVDGC